MVYWIRLILFHACFLTCLGMCSHSADCHIIPEFGGADEDALSSIGNYMKGNMKKFLEKESKLTKDQLLEERYKRFRKF